MSDNASFNFILCREVEKLEEIGKLLVIGKLEKLQFRYV